MKISMILTYDAFFEPFMFTELLKLLGGKVIL